MEPEADQVVKRYKRRNSLPANLYSILNPAIWQGVLERQRALINLLNQCINIPLNDLKILEIGCGSGGNILELIRFGFAPENVMGNELLPERIQLARNNLPTLTRILEGDASKLDIPHESLDVVYQSTVFTSLLDELFQEKLAKKMWDWIKPGGGILWYDFIYNNPNNPDVQGVPLQRIKELFPEGSFTVKRITLAPPISRRVTKIHPSFYTFFNLFPFLRTHVLCYIKKVK